MDKAKMIFGIALGIVFVGTTFISLLGAGRVVNQALRMSFGIVDERCVYPAPSPVDRNVEKDCFPDTRRAKEEIVEGLSSLVVALPISIITLKGLKKNKEI